VLQLVVAVVTLLLFAAAFGALAHLRAHRERMRAAR
jgi:hypothetical protein